MDVEVKAEKLREDGRILRVVDKCISSRVADYERNKTILKEILEDVFSTIKGRDPFFREQFQDFFFVEDCYKGPIDKLKEIDVNIVIKVPVYIKLEGTETDYRRLKLYELPSHYISKRQKYSNIMSSWVKAKKNDVSCQTYELDKKAFGESIKNLLEWAILNVPEIDNYTIKKCEGGSAFTMRVNKQNLSEIKVNLMPVLEFVYKPPNSKWYAVPDPLKNIKDQHVWWRMALYEDENDVLTRHSYLMPVIEQVKKLRDIQGWTVISYYHIKTLFMHYATSIENHSGMPDAFKLTGFKLLIHMLDQLFMMCKTQRLRNFWNSDDNLIDDDESQFVDIGEQLGTMITEIIDDPAKLANWILTSEELSKYQSELTVGILQDTDCPSKSLQTSEESVPSSSKDIFNAVDGVSELNPGATAASCDIKSSSSNEMGSYNAGFSEEIDLHRIIAELRGSVETLSKRSNASEKKSAAEA